MTSKVVQFFFKRGFQIIKAYQCDRKADICSKCEKKSQNKKKRKWRMKLRKHFGCKQTVKKLKRIKNELQQIQKELSNCNPTTNQSIIFLLVQVQQHRRLLPNLLSQLINEFMLLIDPFLFECEFDLFLFDHGFSFGDLVVLLLLKLFQAQELLGALELRQEEGLAVKAEIVSVLGGEGGLGEGVGGEGLELCEEDGLLLLDGLNLTFEPCLLPLELLHRLLFLLIGILLLLIHPHLILQLLQLCLQLGILSLTIGQFLGQPLQLLCLLLLHSVILTIELHNLALILLYSLPLLYAFPLTLCSQHLIPRLHLMQLSLPLQQHLLCLCDSPPLYFALLLYSLPLLLDFLHLLEILLLEHAVVVEGGEVVVELLLYQDGGVFAQGECVWAGGLDGGEGGLGLGGLQRGDGVEGAPHPLRLQNWLGVALGCALREYEGGLC